MNYATGKLESDHLILLSVLHVSYIICLEPLITGIFNLQCTVSAPYLIVMEFNYSAQYVHKILLYTSLSPRVQQGET